MTCWVPAKGQRQRFIDTFGRNDPMNIRDDGPRFGQRICFYRLLAIALAGRQGARTRSSSFFTKFS